MKPAKRERYLLGNLMAYHRREERPAWWEYFDRCENVDQLFEFDKDAIAGLELCEDIPAARIDRSNLYTYRFPEQIHKMELATAPKIRARATAPGRFFASTTSETCWSSRRRQRSTRRARSANSSPRSRWRRTFSVRRWRASVQRSRAAVSNRSIRPRPTCYSNRDPRVSGRAARAATRARHGAGRVGGRGGA